jgi:hypothetical protein
MKLDTLIARIDSVGEVVGNFCGSPIYSLSILKIDTDAARYRRNVGVSNKLPVTDLVPLESTAEVLPGETICTDNVTRRATTTEVIGYDTYKGQVTCEKGTHRVSIEEARKLSFENANITWRPMRVEEDGEPIIMLSGAEFALIHEEKEQQ